MDNGLSLVFDIALFPLRYLSLMVKLLFRYLEIYIFHYVLHFKVEYCLQDARLSVSYYGKWWWLEIVLRNGYMKLMVFGVCVAVVE